MTRARVVPKTSKTITAWWLPSNLKQVPLVMKCQIKEKNQIFPNTNLDPLVKNFGYLQLHSFTFLGSELHSLYLRPFYTMAAGSCPKIAILGQRLLAPNDQNSIEEQVLNLATTPVIVAPVRLARLLWWLPRGAKQSLYGDWCRTWNKCHWSWNVTSAMRKVILKKILDPLRTADDYLQVYIFIFFFALHGLYLGPTQTMAAGSCSKVESLVQPPLL